MIQHVVSYAGNNAMVTLLFLPGGESLRLLIARGAFNTMSHEIDMTKGFAHMATASDNPAPWWESDDMPAFRVNPLDPPARWREVALNWEVKRTECKYQIGTNTFTANRQLKKKDGSYSFVDPRYVIYRDDTFDYLSIASDKYHIHSITQIVDTMAIICDKLGATMSTIGSLRDGREVWFLAKLRDEKIAGELFERNILLGTSYDQRRLSFGCLTDTAVVCSNTLSLALQRPDFLFRLSHREPFNADKLIPVNLDIIAEEQDLQGDIIERLAAKPMDDETMKRYFTGVAFFKRFSDHQQAMRVSEDSEFIEKEFDKLEGKNADEKLRKMARDIKLDSKAIRDCYLYGAGGKNHPKRIDSRVKTAHGATQAVYNFVDHKMLLTQKGISKKNRFSRAFFDDGAKLKRQAQHMALRLVA